MIKLLLIVAAVAAGTSPQQFDLVCSGAAVDDDPSGVFDHKDVHLRIDLKAMKWCEDPPADYSGPIERCAVLKSIAEVQPGVLRLEKENEEEQARGIMHSRSIDRTNGSYMYVHDFMILGRISKIAIKSRCEPAPFSGFPKIKTKF